MRPRGSGAARLPRGLGALTALLLIAAIPARAQTDPRLVEAVRVAQEGQSDSARASVRRLLEATPPTDSLYAEILYTQAMVAGDAAEMRRHLQRVVVEHGASSWADDALLRMVQMDYAIRNFQDAARHLERLRTDYPLTPLVPQAAYWGARTYFELKNETLACRWLADGMARVEENVELQNQLGYLYQRCGAAGQQGGGADSAAAAPDTTATVTGTDTARGVDSAPRGRADSLPSRPAAPLPRFRIQVAAVATPGAADDAATKVESLGLPAVIVREGRFYKVRAGAFATREEAQAALPEVKAGMGGSPFIVAEP